MKTQVARSVNGILKDVIQNLGVCIKSRQRRSGKAKKTGEERSEFRET
jgi:hypothetical protein